jgi:glycosyltransferase involved in cell wall biosynthesis
VKIAFFHHTLRLGSGIDTVIYELANRLAKKNDVSVFCFKTDYKYDMCSFKIREIRSSLANTPTRMMTLAPFILDKVGTLKAEIKDYDLVNTHHYPANYIVRNFTGPLNVVTEWSGVTPKMFSSMKEKLYVKWTRYANRVAAQKADVLLAPCDFVNKWIKENYSIEATTMFLDGVNFEIFDKFRVNSERFFKLYPSFEGKQIILFVGRITESKNIHSLIEVFASVKKRVPDAILVLAGDYQNYMSYYVKLKEIVKARGLDESVVFTGIVSWKDLPSFFSASTVYATCSLWEGFLRAESFAFEKPIVAFDAGANSETVKNGETGFLIKNYNIDEFADKICKILEDERLAKELGAKGYLWARENLDFDSIARRFESFCSRALEDRTGRI